jgi:hypothetical protein
MLWSLMQAGWQAPVGSVTWEADAGGSFESRSSGPALANYMLKNKNEVLPRPAKAK